LTIKNLIMKIRLYKIVIISILFLILICASCRKKDNNPENNSTSVTNEGKDSANYIYGSCRKYVLFIYSHNKEFPRFSSFFGSAYFSLEPVSVINENIKKYVKVGRVYLDNEELTYTGKGYTKKMSYSNYSLPTNWRVSSDSAAKINAFDYSSNQPFPYYENYQSLPYIVSKKNGVQFSFTDCINTNRIKVYIINNLTNIPEKEIIVNDNRASISFTASELLGLAKNQIISFEIYFFNDEIKNINNKNIRFSNVLYEQIENVTVTD
jgi:hypothetical protein